jgi:G3E family GTPase
MRAAVYIVSGFLGAGKTTLIQKLIRDCCLGKNVALIENDFGEISVDAALMKAVGVEVKELNSGCICCSLSGDFVAAMTEVHDRLQPDVIIIEPSGVGKLSEILSACAHPRLRETIEVRGRITVVDVKRCRMYLDNFGEFFEDQVKCADTVVLSRVEEFPDQVAAARSMVEALNDRCAVVEWPLGAISGDEILNMVREKKDGPVLRTFRMQSRGDRHEHGADCNCHEHEPQGHDRHFSPEHGLVCRCGHGAHDSSCHCHEHGHDADDVFETMTLRLGGKVSLDALRRMMAEILDQCEILRAKGILPCFEGQVNLQYVPGQMKITRCTTEGNALCLIGRDLDRGFIERIVGKR